jgi:uncharacterized protein DUF6064
MGPCAIDVHQDELESSCEDRSGSWRPIVLPFTPEQFLSLFSTYNDAIWPAQVIAYLLGGIAVVALFGKSERSDRIVAAVLATMWAWTGFAYHLAFFTTINKAAYVFGALFAIQAFALANVGVFHHRIFFGLRPSPTAWVGIFFVVYAAMLYPLVGMVAGHLYPELPMFGVTPCPVTIFTFGMLLLTQYPPPALLLVIPGLWSLIGGSAAILLSVPQDWPLLVSGIVTVGLNAIRSREEMAA